MKSKQILVRSVLIVEMVVFAYIYMFGKNGLYLLQAQKKQLHALQHTIDVLEKEIIDIEEAMKDWQAYDFYKEKIAREQLQMARKNDKLFYIG